MTESAGEPMIVDCDASQIAAACTNQAPDTDGLLHPLVILNISDHWTRTKAQNSSKSSQKVYGALLGKHEGRKLEVINSFELKMFDSAGVPTVDRDFLQQREQQYKEVFAELDLIGWYCTGEGAPSNIEMAIQKSFVSTYESPVFLKLDISISPNCTKLPATIWECAGSEACSTAGMRAVPWTLVSEESERIGVDHVNRFSAKAGSEKESEVAKTIRSNNAAVSMLVSRVKLIRDYLEAVKEKMITPKDEILREANKLWQMIMRLDPKTYDNVTIKQEEDVNVSMLLSRMTEICGNMNDLVSHLNTINSDRVNVGGPMKGGHLKKGYLPPMMGGNMFPSESTNLFNV